MQISIKVTSQPVGDADQATVGGSRACEVPGVVRVLRLRDQRNIICCSLKLWSALDIKKIYFMCLSIF